MGMQTIFDPETINGRDFLPTDYLWQVSVAGYHAMIKSGALTEDDPIELLQGWLIQKMPKNPRHSTITRLIRQFLAQLIPNGWYVDSQEPITTDDSEPEPDVVVIRGDAMDYMAHHPGPNDIAILVEVADATLRRDQTLKKQLYAKAGIPIYWIVNLPLNQIEVYTKPFMTTNDANYQEQHTYMLTDSAPVVIENKLVGEIPVVQVMPSL